MTPEERKELNEIQDRLLDLEAIVAESLPETADGPETQHHEFVARIRARRKK